MNDINPQFLDDSFFMSQALSAHKNIIKSTDQSVVISPVEAIIEDIRLGKNGGFGR